MNQSAVDQAMRDGFRELARRGDPAACQCYAIVDNDSGILHPHYCDYHRKIAIAERIKFGYVTYERAFLIEADARDRAHIVRFLHKCDDTRAEVVRVGRYWLVLAQWGLVKTGNFNGSET